MAKRRKKGHVDVDVTAYNEECEKSQMVGVAPKDFDTYQGLMQQFEVWDGEKTIKNSWKMHGHGTSEYE